MAKKGGRKGGKRKDEEDWEGEVSRGIKDLAVSNKGSGDEGESEDEQPKKAQTVGKMSAFAMLQDDSDEGDAKSNSSDDEGAPAIPVKQPQPKKTTGKQPPANASDDEDLDDIMAALDKPRDAGLTAREAESDSEEPAPAVAAKSAFALLADEDGAEDKSDDSDAEPAERSSSAAAAVKKEPVKEKKRKEKKKPKKKDDDDDLDKLLEDLDKPKESKKKKKGATEAGADDQAAEVGEATGDPPAADEDLDAEEAERRRKKKEKRDKKKKKEKSEEPGAEGEEAQPDGGDDGKDGDGADDKKKKKKKKDKDDDKEEKKGKLKKGQIAKMREALQQMEEEKEKARLKAIEEEQKREDAMKRMEENAQKEKEAREKKKQKAKERVARQKAEGTFKTAAEKERLQRHREALELMKSQGLNVPSVPAGDADGEAKPTKRVKYVDKRKLNRMKQQQQEPSPTPEEPKTPEPKTPSPSDFEKIPTPEEEHEESDEIADSWDMVDDQPDKAEVSKKSEKKKVEKQPSAEAEESGDESESEESSEESESESESSSSEEEQPVEKRSVREIVRERITKRKVAAEQKKDAGDLRAPVVVVLGHVDTGKTKILDKIRRTNVQHGEAGGITQQIGATRIPAAAIKEKASMVKDLDEIRIPGLLVIDTPGHESFSNLRSRGSSLCDVAILVVDIMHGLEPQTRESIELLRKGKTPFIVALNKIDRLYEWKQNPHKDVRNVLKGQQRNTELEFKERFNEVLVQFAELGLNVCLFHDNKDPSEYVSMVPTSAHSGDGMGNLLAEVVRYCETQIPDKITFVDELQCSVLEVKALTGLGTTIDVILINGHLRVGDTIVVPGSEGPIVTQIRELLMPQPMQELRVKNPYEHYKELKGAQGVKILGKDLEKALAGLPIVVAHKEDELDYLKDEVALSLKHALQSIKLSDQGVYVQASTLGALEALLEFLRTSKIPFSGINIGPVHKKDVMKVSTMLDHAEGQYAVLLAFDVKVDRDAEELARSNGVRIFTAEIIYHLFDAFTNYQKEWMEAKRKANEHLAVFPCKLRILPECVFNSRNPIVVGVTIESGVIKKGTPLCVPTKEFCEIGQITNIQANHKDLEVARKGQEVCIKIENCSGDAPKMLGRHFELTDLLVSKISRESIDVCKEYFRDDLTKPDWQLIVELKKLFKII